jgi:hypothetical protein
MYHVHFPFLNGRDVTWPFSQPFPMPKFNVFQRDVLNFLLPTDKYCAHSGGLFHFGKDQGTYSIDPADYPGKPLFAAATNKRLLNEFFLLVLQDVHEWQSLRALQFTSDEPQFVKELIERVYPAIPWTANAPALPETRVFSRPLIAYMVAYLPVTSFFWASDTRVTGVCDDQYTATLEKLQETNDDKFKMNLTRKVIAWFRRWPFERSSKVNGASFSDAAGDVSPPANPGPAVAVAAPKARVQAPTVSEDEDGRIDCSRW